jgi:hypothetical protein
VKCLFTAFIIVSSLRLYSQGGANTSALKQRLIAELMPHDEFESWCQGDACQSISELHRKTDTLLAVSTITEAAGYFRDTSYSLKIYSFLHIVERDDQLAFALLQESINDSILVDYIGGCVSTSIKFNELLVFEYRSTIKMKYYYGGPGTKGGRVRIFPPKDRRTWRKKERELNELISKK